MTGVVVVALIFAYLLLSSPGEVVVNEQGQIDGLMNRTRELLQRKNFWEGQQRFVQKELKLELDEPTRMTEFKESMRELEENARHVMEKRYQEYPEMRPSPAQRQANALRELADKIEFAEFEREMELATRKRIERLRQVQHYIEAKTR